MSTTTSRDCQSPVNSSTNATEPTKPNSAEEKGFTFRKRRLSLTNLRLLDTQGLQGDHEGDDDQEKGDLGEGGLSMDDEVEGGDGDGVSFDLFQAFQQQKQELHHPQQHQQQQQQQHHSLEKQSSQTVPQGEKGTSFRKRRLSLTQNRQGQQQKHQQQLEKVNEDSSHDDDEEQEDDAGSHGHLVDGLSNLPQTPQQQLLQETPNVTGQRRLSDASASSYDPSPRLKSRTVHASELLAHPPPSPSILSSLYQPTQQSSKQLQQQQQLHRSNLEAASSISSLGETGMEGHTAGADTVEVDQPRWKQRHTRHIHDDEKTLPFPRDIVGTFSCHGMEPVYDDDYLDDDDDEEEEEDDEEVGEDEEYVEGDEFRDPNRNSSHKAETSNKKDSDQPTTAAKINQDRGGVAFPYGNNARTALFAVYDGHGQGGELVAQFALHEVQRRLEKHAEFDSDIEKAFKETFLAVDNALKDEDLIEPLFAGTTACVALLRDQQLVLANAGDSRAVLARKVNVTAAENEEGGGEHDNDMSNATSTQYYKAIDLTQDLNPDLPEEQARIESMGGFVSPPLEPGLSARVWLDADCTQIGLAMARSIGDHAVKAVGVIAEPVVSYHTVDPQKDEFVLFASDGVWEFVSSQEAVDVVAANLDRGATRACQALIETAAAKWHEEEGDYRDDITALVVRLPLLWTSEQANSAAIKMGKIQNQQQLQHHHHKSSKSGGSEPAKKRKKKESSNDKRQQ